MHKRPRWLNFRTRTYRTNVPSDFGDIYEKALHIARTALPKRAKAYEINQVVNKLRDRANASRESVDMLAALFVQAPRASIAQRQMDEHRHGYHDKNTQLFELIDFNDMFDSAILGLDRENRAKFSERAKECADEICKLVHAPCFTNAQWESITRGLGREIAIFLAAKDNGFDAFMTARTQDALGIDMQIRDPASGKYINIDCKSPPSFRHRMEDLVHEGRANEADIFRADEKGYFITHNGRAKGRKEVILFSVLPDFYGNIVDFEFEDSRAIRDKLGELIWKHGLTDDDYGVNTSL